MPGGTRSKVDVEDAPRDQLQLMHLQTWPSRQCNHRIAWKEVRHCRPGSGGRSMVIKPLAELKEFTPAALP